MKKEADPKWTQSSGVPYCWNQKEWRYERTLESVHACCTSQLLYGERWIPVTSGKDERLKEMRIFHTSMYNILDDLESSCMSRLDANTLKIVEQFLATLVSYCKDIPKRKDIIAIWHCSSVRRPCFWCQSTTENKGQRNRMQVWTIVDTYYARARLENRMSALAH